MSRKPDEKTVNRHGYKPELFAQRDGNFIVYQQGERMDGIHWSVQLSEPMSYPQAQQALEKRIKEFNSLNEGKGA